MVKRVRADEVYLYYYKKIKYSDLDDYFFKELYPYIVMTTDESRNNYIIELIPVNLSERMSCIEQENITYVDLVNYLEDLGYTFSRDKDYPERCIISWPESEENKWEG